MAVFWWEGHLARAKGVWPARYGSLGLAMTLVAIAPLAPARAAAPPEPVLAVGIEQRFGQHPNAKLLLAAPPGDRLTLQPASPPSASPSAAPQTLTVDSVELTGLAEPLPEPELREWVVLGTYRSFESAEESAQRWRSRGIPVEIAKPNRWQVWADRATYRSPALRRMLMESLAALGDQGGAASPESSLESTIVRQRWRPQWRANGQSGPAEGLQIHSGSGVIQVGGVNLPEAYRRRFGGRLSLLPDAYDTFTLVNHVPLETYLRGVVPYEIGPDAADAALAVQAILARTYALRNVRRFAIDGYQLCADTHCQVYRGLSNLSGRLEGAIARTRGQVLTHGNELVDALYFSSSGGVTASFSDVWNGSDRPYLRPVVDMARPLWNLTSASLAEEANLRRFLALPQAQFNEAGWGDFRWRRTSSLAEIAQNLRDYLRNNRHPLANLRTVASLRVTERGVGGRIRALVAASDRGEVTIPKDAIRSALQAPKSTFFVLDPLYEADGKTLRGYAFVGGGWGHGVGLSQSGARRLAQQGWSIERILQFYYPGTTLEPLRPDIVTWREPKEQ